jgi:chromosome segregation ATPase
MAITYNKQKITKDRLISTSGPRDRQIKQQQMSQYDNSDLIAELRNQISNLQDKLASSQSGGWTDDQVNAEIVKAIKEETSKYKSENEALILEVSSHEKKLRSAKTKIELLEKDVKSLEEKLDDKNKLIDELKKRKSSETDNNVTALITEATKKIEALSLQVASSNDITTQPDRPQMETVFVDPIEKESKVESHFDVEDISTSEKEALEEKKNKLKSLLGKLPRKR